MAAYKRLWFLVLQQIPDRLGEKFTLDGPGYLLGETPVAGPVDLTVAPGLICLEVEGMDHPRASLVDGRDGLCPRVPVEYRDKRKRTRKALMAELMGLEDVQSVTQTTDRNAELAASELIEAQRTQVLSAAGLDDQAE